MVFVHQMRIRSRELPSVPQRVIQPYTHCMSIVTRCHRHTAATLCCALLTLLPGCRDEGALTGDAQADGDVHAAQEQVDLDALWPPVRTDPPALLDFGEVLLGTPVTTTIELVNHGDKELELEAARTNCGCTTANVAGMVVPANEKIDLPITFDAEGKLGARSATVDLLFKGWERPIRFRVKAFVVEQQE